MNLGEMEGDYAAWTYFQSVATPENEEFVRRLLEKYPQRNVTDPMEAAYVGVKLWAKAVTEADSLDPKKIRRAMLNQRFQAPCGEVRIDADTQHCYKTPRIGRILMGTGRDATDVAMSTAFGPATLSRFEVITEEVPQGTGKAD